MFFGEQGLIGVIAFEGNAEKHLAFAVKKLAQGIHLVTPPWLERHTDQQDIFTRLHALDNVLLHVWWCDATAVQIQHVHHSGVSAGHVAGLGAGTREECSSLRMVRAKLWSPELRPASLANLERIASPDSSVSNRL